MAFPARAPAPTRPSSAVTVEAVVAQRMVQPLFQPIVDLSTRRVVGWEALARGPAGSDLEFPDRLFAAARAAGLVAELDMLCAERALECALSAPSPPPLLFVNAEPGVLDQPLSPRLIELVHSGLPFREVLEFTERALPNVPGSLLRIAGMVQLWGNGLALDDVGVDPMSLAFLPILEPEVIKLDMGLVRAPYARSTRAVCEVVGAEARRTGAVIIAEGIETEQHLHAARALGAHWGQGWLFGRPAPVGRAAHDFDPVAAAALRAPRPGFHQPTAGAWQIATSHAPAVAGMAAADASLELVRSAIADDPAAIIVAAQGGDVVIDITRSSRAMDRLLHDDFTVAVIGAGYGYAVSMRSSPEPATVTLRELPAVAEVARALLNRMA
jgi:EAL domain-containing protein (putative c-di-GMP-specific phosphodiesterase class I)